MSYLLLGAALLAAIYLLVRAFLAAEPRALVRAARYGGVAAGALALGFLAYTGRTGMAMMLAGLAMPLLARMRNAWRTESGGRKTDGQGPGAASRVETVYLRMSLDHATGAMAGEVLYGPWRGRQLDHLASDQLMALLADCRRDDLPSVGVLEAWLDRCRPGWRDWPAAGDERGGRQGSGESPRSATGSGTMTRDEAYDVLGLLPGASADQIKEAHRRLMMKVHPDHGGSTYLAAKLNQAKDLLHRH